MLARRECMNARAVKNDRWMAANAQAMETSDAPHEVRHQFTDYRNDNEALASRVMTRHKAACLNARLKGTGFGWNVKTGY